MESFYEINVAYKGQHYFATAPRSIKTESVMRTVAGELRRRFKKSEGFEVTVTYWHAEGHRVDV